MNGICVQSVGSVAELAGIQSGVQVQVGHSHEPASGEALCALGLSR